MTLAPAWTNATIVGMEARIRESSWTLPSASGTLKSTRTKTRLPATSASRIVSLSMTAIRARSNGGDRQSSGHVGDQVRDPAAVAPFVVVPGDDLDHVAAQHHRRFGVDDRGARVAAEVGRHQRLVGDAEDALERAGGRGPEGIVQLVHAGLAPDRGGEVDHADGRRRDAQAEA